MYSPQIIEFNSLVDQTKSALDAWMSNPKSKPLQEQFKEANQALLDFSRSHKELKR